MSIGLAITVGALLLLSSCLRENLESHYRTYTEAVAAGAIARGWIPKWLPSTASDIHEEHNIDTNATLLAFDYGTAGPEQFLATCHRDSRVPRNPGSDGWWPDDATWHKLQFYRCDERDVYQDGHVKVTRAGAAIDTSRRKAYFWR